jgi:hypothetical protein
MSKRELVSVLERIDALEQFISEYLSEFLAERTAEYVAEYFDHYATYKKGD